MFLDFFQLRQQPFGVTPDPTYLYPSETHCEALDALTEGIMGGRGFLVLIAEPGMGKTTLLYQVLEGLRDTARTAFLFQTQCNSREFFQYLLSELGVDSTGMELVAMHSKLNEMLFAEMLAGKRFVLIVDEAQNLDDSVLETIRLLSNFETSNTKLLQIVLAGQPELGQKLGQPRLAQLLQRITVVKHLAALSPKETAGYIRHRLKVAGHSGGTVFEPLALECVAQLSQGVPRIINRICFNALQEAHARGCHTVSPEMVEIANRKLKLFGAAIPVMEAEAVPVPAPTAVTQTPASVPIPAKFKYAAGAPAIPELSYKPLAELRLPRRRLWTAALVAFLLLVGLILSRNELKKALQIVHDRVVANLVSSPLHKDRGSSIGNDVRTGLAEFSSNLLMHKASANGRFTPGASDSADKREVTEQRPDETGMPNVTSILASSAAKDARVIVMLDGAVQYDSARIPSPDRIYFDLYKSHLSPSAGQKTVPNEVGLLKSVRAAQNRDEVVRLVLDADGARDYSAQLLSNPYRLVIDVHAQPSAGTMSAATPSSNSGAAMQSVSQTPLGTTVSPETQLSLTRELGLKINRIVIDPGHGGYDTGTTGPRGLLEKNLCLDVALRVGQLIEENIAGAQVVYTRKDDKHVSLERRTAIANAAKADLFISIHANASDSSEARGVETYYLSLAGSQEAMELAARENALAQSSVHDLPELIKKITRNDKVLESKQLATNIQDALSQRLEQVSRRETNRGVKQAPFVVLTGANMPAVLSEISFVSNATDENLLLDGIHRQRVAEGLYRGVASYLDSLHSLPHQTQKLVSQDRPVVSSRN